MWYLNVIFSINNNILSPYLFWLTLSMTKILNLAAKRFWRAIRLWPTVTVLAKFYETKPFFDGFHWFIDYSHIQISKYLFSKQHNYGSGQIDKTMPWSPRREMNKSLNHAILVLKELNIEALSTGLHPDLWLTLLLGQFIHQSAWPWGYFVRSSLNEISLT